MDLNLPPLIQALLQPQAYPHKPVQVELVQTHISWVLLAGSYAYKIKKPLKLSFLDFSTLDLRHARCLDELRLNQRFAPQVYLDVVSIYRGPNGPCFEPLGEPVEYAVRMRRFDESARLDHVCARGELTPQHLSALAQTLDDFYAHAERVAPVSQWGTPAQALNYALDNFPDLRRVLDAAASQATLNALQHWTQQQFDALQPLMQARRQGGWVRECHGDLHLGNLVLLDDQVCPFDCIEFSDALRWIDVLSDLAFTYEDLLAHCQPGLACWFINELASCLGFYPSAALLRFYAVYRCLVRAKVAAIRVQQTGEDASPVRAQVALAQRLVAPPALRLTVTHGLSGCGKTWLTDRLLQSSGDGNTLRLRADVQRKRLFGLEPLARSSSALNSGLYAPDAHRRTYDHLRETAASLLGAGWSVVVDATFLRRTDRDAFRNLAHERGAQFGILAPQASPEQLRARIQARQVLGRDASEATLEVLAQQMRQLEPLTDDEKRMLVSVKG
ncbi:MAG: hypothetical protein AUJ20_01865 [Comamonadaceae bacterium CG1_02_60_18]|nr:MAG: hypothetical protein AUJ20_01865 [Comamonadaceae bacterium CG1_02_60_18]PIQ55580.1 MAG: hypothetical protein COW02_03085 [Comamonadaceae bacterium CG12_big_fil_rev_8_21_14_0_65_59_15]